MSNKDFNDRIAKLLSDSKDTVQETDDALAQRFNKVFAAEPIAKQQNLSYHVPDSAYTDVDEEIARMLQEDDDEHDDDINDMIYGALSSQQDERLVTEAEEKLSGAQTLFLGSDFGNDESDALIRRIQEEDALDSKYQTFAKTRDDEFESRVHALQKEAPITTATYDDKPAGSIPKPLLKEDLHDEMDDWCTICNEDATIECLGCDNDKYCSHCFYETHRSEMADYDATTHKSKSYTKQF